MSKELAIRDPREVGVSPSALLKLVERWETLGGVHSFVLVRHGDIAAQGWWKPYAPDRRHMLFSLSKSFTSTAIHFAASEGLVNFDATVLSYFPDYAAKLTAVDEKLSQIKVKHLLSMCTGHKPSADFIFNYGDSVAAFLASAPEAEAGVGFNYNTGATYMASAIVQRVTGQTVLDYLRPRLLEPLGIENIAFDSCSKGINYGGFGLNVLTGDIAKFGKFLLQRGMWEGRQLIPSEYVDMMTSKHINNWGDSKFQKLDEFEAEEQPESVRKNDWCQGYGRQFWRCVPDNVYRGDGAFGQLCVVMPDQDAVMAVTAGLGDMQAELNAIWALIDEGGFDYKGGEGDEALRALNDKLSSLALPIDGGKCYRELADFSGRSYQLPGNMFDFAELKFTFGEDSDVIHIKNFDGSEYDLSLGHGYWLDTDIQHKAENDAVNGISDALSSDAYDSGEKFSHLSAISSADGNVYRCRIAQNRTPFVRNIEFTFIADRISLAISGDGEQKLTGYAI